MNERYLLLFFILLPHVAPPVLIVGGGMAGMSAGCFARMSRFETEILEMHSIPGDVVFGNKGFKHLKLIFGL